jgi:hypothetical protein
MTKTECEDFRRKLKPIADALWAHRQNWADPASPGEAIANVTLAYRHLEDASICASAR